MMRASLMHLRQVFSQRPWIYAVLLNIATLGYLLTAYQPAHTIREDLQVIREDLNALRARDGLSFQQLTTRLDTLEQTLYGEIEPGLKEKRRPIVTPSPADWQRNRDLELQRRISALEQWRYMESGQRHGQ